MKCGINLYSLRGCVTTNEDFYETSFKLKDMGYDYLQCSGMKLSAEEIKAVCDRTGMSVKLTHSPFKRILEDTDALVREHDLLGCDYIGIGSYDISAAKTQSDALKIVEALENAAVLLKSKGKKFVYHNHSFEFAKFEGTTFYDLMIEHSRELGFILDTYWVQAGGASVLEYVNRLGGRIDCVHLKDYKMEGNTPRFAAVGDGNLNFKDITAAMHRAGTKYYFVEQDDAETYDDPFAEVKKSIDSIKQIHI